MSVGKPDAVILHPAEPRILPVLPRRAVYGPAPTRLPRPTGLGLALGIVLALLVAGVGVAIARADEEEPTRYTPTSRGTRHEVARWRPLLEEYADWDVDTGLRVIDCESGGDPAVWNHQGSGAVGLWQLLGWEWLARRLFGSALMTDPWINTATAHVIWLESGGRFGTSMGWAASAGCWS